MDRALATLPQVSAVSSEAIEHPGRMALDDEIERLRARVAELERVVDQRCRAIAMLETGERRFRSLIESMRRIAFYHGEIDGDITLYGADAQAITGAVGADGKLDEQLWYRSVHPDDVRAYRTAEARQRETGEAYSLEFRYNHPLTDRLIWVRQQAYVVTGADGRRFRDGYILDITAEKEQESRLIEATESAITANRAKTQFLANMSHELRTPLNAIIGFSELILDRSFGPVGIEKYEEYCQDIHASASHLLRLIEDILDVSKVESGRVELREGLFDIGSLINSTLRMIRDHAAGKELLLATELEEHLPQICADERRIRQILINLLSNAVKFTEAGGKVTVSVREREDGGVTITVSDTGIGIPEQDIPRAMQPFVQLHNGLSRQFEGSGIGLALSAKMAEVHGGRLELTSQVGFGTQVSLVLPPERSMRSALRSSAEA